MAKRKNKPQLRRHRVGKNTVLYKAAEKAGFTKEQIAGFKSEEALKRAIRSVKPGLLLELEGPKKKVKTPIKPPEPKLEPKVLTFSIEIDEWRVESANHAAMEEMQVQSNLRSRHIRNIDTISIVRSLKPNKQRKLVSQVTVNYRG